MKRLTTEQLFWSHVDKTAGCWEWTARQTTKGYGMWAIGPAANNKWAARTQHHGREYYGGEFETPEEAGESAKQLRLRLFTHNDADRARRRIS